MPPWGMECWAKPDNGAAWGRSVLCFPTHRLSQSTAEQRCAKMKREKKARWWADQCVTASSSAPSLSVLGPSLVPWWKHTWHQLSPSASEPTVTQIPAQLPPAMTSGIVQTFPNLSEHATDRGRWGTAICDSWVWLYVFFVYLIWGFKESYSWSCASAAFHPVVCGIMENCHSYHLLQNLILRFAVWFGFAFVSSQGSVNSQIIEP